MPRATALVFAALLGLWAAVPASAGLPSARPPDPPTLRAAGVAVSWPVRGTADFAPGDRIVVRVRALRPAAGRPLARITFVAVDDNGRAVRALAAQSLRDGVFATRLPEVPGARYALRLDLGKQRYWSWITAAGVPGSPSPPPPPPPNPDRSTAGPPSCPPRGTSSFDVKVDPAAGRVNDHLTVTVTNTGTTCVTGGWDYSWERRLPDGSYEPVGGSHPVPAIGVTAQPGGSFSHGASVWPEMQPPGSYRFVKTLSGPDGPLTVTVPFEVQG